MDSDGDGVFDRAERFVYDGADVVLVFDAGGSLTTRYLHGPAVDQVFASEDALGDVLWALSDNQGTVQDIVEYDDATGTTGVANHLQYDAFGKITAESDASVDFLYAYTGRIWDADADADLYYYRARWYDPAVGRFASEDPIGFAAGDPNLVRYTFNSPTNLTDPSGLQPPGSGGFFNSLSSNWWSMQQTYAGLILEYYYENEQAAEEAYSSAYEHGPLGQTQDSSGLYYYGPRGALGVASAATAGACVVGASEAIFLGNNSVLAEGALMGGRIKSGGLLQFRPSGRPPWVRFDYHAFRTGGPKLPHIDSPLLGKHHWPW